MKKLLGIFYIFITTLSFGNYDYPFHNPNIATIFGSSNLMVEGVSTKVPRKEYSIKLPWTKAVGEEFWYNEGFKFSLVPQKTEAPLVFLLAGTGSSHNSIRMEYFQRIFYDAGYHVVSISSPMNNNFIINGSSSRMPGLIMEDSKDIYNIMKEINKRISKKIKVSDFYVVGYSLGATEAGILSYIDESEKEFNFKRVFMINPAVNLYNSALKLDNYLDFPENERAEKIGGLIEKIIDTVVSSTLPEYTSIDIETIYKLFSKNKLTNKEMQELIGGAFRLTSIDLNYITDVINNRKVYVKEPVGKFTPMFGYFEKINFATFDEYINRVALPYYREKLGEDLKLEQLVERARLNNIEDYLKNSSKIAVVTNADELILDESDFEFLKSTFGNRLLIYPYGGHCGNMFFSTNVKIMLEFLEKGELSHEI
ncbi:serine/threonine protein kinase [Fusobacterium sp.]|uniref:serine/threonine protein kinase n=1 Tax=Fusobacterium sp. TaxID=68766 RepID=UPI0025C6756C|nr:serine/threonine protein kinase [Fusobacterium sp.]